jgi:hypothetical protein
MTTSRLEPFGGGGLAIIVTSWLGVAPLVLAALVRLVPDRLLRCQTADRSG